MNEVEAQTKQRLIEAAGEVFAEHGFHAATIREISKRAKANIAAVNYHFGDKEKLYRAVFQYAHSHAVQNKDKLLPDTEPAEQRLRAFVDSVLLRMFDEGRPAWLTKLLTREMMEPTGVLDEMVNDRIRPNHLRLKGICRELLGPGADDETARQAAFNVVAQCMFYHRCRSVVERLYPETQYTAQYIEKLADCITKFSIGGMKELRA